MLKLKGITKHYATGNSTVEALRGIDLEFRKSEFVSILGQSGCGKTTLLNIIGGLDRYTDGDLVINGVSTKTFKDSDWDAYRNHSIGFVFQSYNLIPHQSVLSNVELALTLSGVSKTERRRRAIEALERVGLGDQLHKRPNQMSGGQMQRVAIARALVNDPDILLADEPTGALDTSTSVQIMEILKEISNDRLIIMVTHNPELAETYSTRIIKVLDGLVIDDSNPYTAPAEATGESEDTDEVNAQSVKKQKKEKKAAKSKKVKKPSMSFFTALSLSLNNLATKKGRTAMTSFAGSIGIIGIALILALSSGINLFIDDIQKDTLSSFPITIYDKETDLSSVMENLSDKSEGGKPDHEKDAVYSNPMLYDLIHTMNSAEEKTNNLEKFKEFLDDRENHDIGKYISAVQYTYDVDLNMYTKDAEGNYNKADISKLFMAMSGGQTQGSSMGGMAASFSGLNTWSEILPGIKDSKGEYTTLVSDMVSEQYDVIHGRWPEAANEVVLVLDKNNEITDMTLYALGLITEEDIINTITSAMKGDDSYVSETKRYTYEEICGVKYKLLINAYHYEKNTENGLWKDISEDDLKLELNIDKYGYDVEIVGIIRPNEESTSTLLSGSLAYTAALTEYVIDETLKTDIAKEQLKAENSNYDIFTGLNFVTTEDPTKAEKIVTLKDYAEKSKESAKAQLYFDIMCTPADEEVETLMKQYKDQFFADGEEADYRQMLSDLILSQNLLEGMDEETLHTFLEGYSDEELEEMVDEYLEQTVRTQLYDSKKAVIVAKINAPTEEELAGLKAQISAGILSQEIAPGMTMTKEMYVAYTYSQMTGVPSETYIGMIYGGQINAELAFDSLVSDMATKMYNENASSSDAKVNAAAALMLDELIASSSDDELVDIYDNYLPSGLSENTYEDNLSMIGICDLKKPSSVNIYANTFENKDAIAEEIKKYNEDVDKEDEISYTDYVAILMSSVTTIINVISYVLIGFVSVSLVVSSIMIGIITNISVLERTKEIGILRAVGASKRDVSRVFNAETVIIGFCAGLIGVGSTSLLCIPVSLILRELTGFSNLTAYVPLPAAIALVLISVLLTLIAGIIPARSAAKKDPVIALRTE